MDFEKELLEAAQHSIVKLLRSGDWLKLDWSNKLHVKTEVLKGIMLRVDMERVKDLLQAKIEERIADKMFHAMAEEIATDTKRILSNTELREDLRAVLRDKIRAVAASVE